ncbi:MAG: amidohydrolase [Synergistetes bacterium]|nr:amidohydrolase [Synergistota bacterium]
MMERIKEKIDEIYPHVVEVRRKIHEHPELRLQEYETSKIVASELQKVGWQTLSSFADTTAVIGILEGKKDGPTRAFRADMDALPIKEETGLPYSSKIDGVMHACGHDFHTAILIGLAYILSELKESLKGKVVLVFQPGEEGGFGGKILTEAGLIEKFGIEYIIGQHLFPNIPFGKIGYRKGVMTANADSFRIIIQGAGGHGARPEETIDPVAVSSHITLGLYTLLAREISPMDPTVITVGSIRAGKAGNVIPSEAIMEGTIRTLGERNREKALNRLKSVAEGIASTFRAKAQVEIELGYPSVINDPEITDKVTQAGKIFLGDENVIEIEHPSMGGEDFAYYLRKTKGSFYRIGVGPSYPLHNSKFAPNEEALKIGMGINATIALLLP